MISVACRTAAGGEKGSTVYWSLSTFTARELGESGVAGVAQYWIEGA